MTVIYVVEGARTESLEGFWRVMGEAVNGPGGYFGGTWTRSPTA
ncbi:hypothetical protein [Actinomadura sp. KC216]|nr:hypothetical protein [Actinomadura sp. KC216]